jgi:hypothetical protein
LLSFSLSVSVQEVKILDGIAVVGIAEGKGKHEKNGKKSQKDPNHHFSLASLR